MADYRLEPVSELTRIVPATQAEGLAVSAMSLDDPDYHCPNCLYLPDPTGAPGFWACQNLCIRD